MNQIIETKQKTIYAISNNKPNSIRNSSGDFFLNQVDAHAAKSRHRMGLDVFEFQAPIDEINEAIVSGNLYDNVIHMELCEKLTLLKHTMSDDKSKMLDRARVEFANVIEENPPIYKVIEDALTTLLPIKQAARAMINFTPSLARKLINEHVKAELEAVKFQKYYEPTSIMERSLDSRSINMRDEKPEVRARYYAALLKKFTDSQFVQMTSAFIDGKEYSFDIEFDIASDEQDVNSTRGIIPLHITLSGPIEFKHVDGMLEIKEDVNMQTYHVAGRDAFKLIQSMDNLNENPKFVDELVNHAKAMKNSFDVKPFININKANENGLK